MVNHTGMCPVTTRTLITKPDGSQIVSTLPAWMAGNTYRESDGYQLAEVQGVETMHGFRILTPLAKSMYCAANHC